MEKQDQAEGVVMDPGTKVGARRWPGAMATQPWCWGTPWKGTLLAVDDPRAWVGSIALGPGKPTKKATAAHVAWCRKQGLLQDTVPVLWHFDGGDKVHWERTDRVRPYAEDVLAWRKELAEAWKGVSPERLAA